jgi:hypothetical protein
MADRPDVRTGPVQMSGARKADLPRAGQVRGRVAAIAAAVVVTVGLAGFIWVGSPVGDTRGMSAVVSYYHQDTSVVAGAVLGFVLEVGCLLLIWFFAELRSRLADTMLTQVAYTFAVVGAALVMAGTGIMLGPTGVDLVPNGTFVGASVALAVIEAGVCVVILGGIYPIAAAIFMLSLAALRQRAALPTWLAIVGMVFGVLLTTSLLIVPISLLAIWLMVVAGTGFRQPAVASV